MTKPFDIKKGIVAWMMVADNFPIGRIFSNGEYIPSIAFYKEEKDALEDFCREIDDCKVIKVLIKNYEEKTKKLF